MMECINFAAFLDVDCESEKEVNAFLQKELDRMVPELLTEEQFALVNQKKLLQFFTSPLARRMAEAEVRGDLFREKPFVMDYEDVLVQGIIDVFWIEGDKIVLLDYKTDRVKVAEELVTRYQKQLELYATALCKFFSRSTSEIKETENLIYSFSLNQIVVL